MEAHRSLPFRGISTITRSKHPQNVLDGKAVSPDDRLAPKILGLTVIRSNNLRSSMADSLQQIHAPPVTTPVVMSFTRLYFTRIRSSQDQERLGAPQQNAEELPALNAPSMLRGYFFAASPIRDL